MVTHISSYTNKNIPVRRYVSSNTNKKKKKTPTCNSLRSDTTRLLSTYISITGDWVNGNQLVELSTRWLLTEVGNEL